MERLAINVTMKVQPTDAGWRVSVHIADPGVSESHPYFQPLDVATIDEALRQVRRWINQIAGMSDAERAERQAYEQHYAPKQRA